MNIINKISYKQKQKEVTKQTLLVFLFLLQNTTMQMINKVVFLKYRAYTFQVKYHNTDLYLFV